MPVKTAVAAPAPDDPHALRLLRQRLANASAYVLCQMPIVGGLVTMWIAIRLAEDLLRLSGDRTLFDFLVRMRQEGEHATTPSATYDAEGLWQKLRIDELLAAPDDK